jgi:hypothetical protein
VPSREIASQARYARLLLESSLHPGASFSAAMERATRTPPLESGRLNQLGTTATSFMSTTCTLTGLNRVQLGQAVDVPDATSDFTGRRRKQAVGDAGSATR